MWNLLAMLMDDSDFFFDHHCSVFFWDAGLVLLGKTA